MGTPLVPTAAVHVAAANPADFRDIAEVSTAQGKLRLFVAIDRTSKFAFVRLVESTGTMEAVGFLRELVKAVP